MNKPKVDNIKKAGEELNIGAILFSKGDFKGSIKSFEKVIQIDPNFPTAYFNLALAYQRLGQYSNAIKYFKSALKLSPDDAEAKNLLAENYYHLGDYQQALEYRPNYPEALTNLGALYAREGKFTEALESYQKSLSIDNNYSTTYVFLGNVLLAQGNLEDAVMCYKMAIEKDNGYGEAYNNLGTTYARQQKYGNAVTAFKKALKLTKNSEQILGNVAMAYASAKKSKESLKYFKKAFSLFPENGMLAANLFFQMREVADWDEIVGVEKHLDEITNQEIKLGIRPGEDPFINVIRDENPKRNLAVARLWSQNIESGISQRKKFRFEERDGGKINIGYLSAHFHDHPTSHLISRLFETHDKKKFNVFVYSAGPDDGSVYTKKIASSGVKFTDLYNLNFSESAVKIYKDKIDILVDLDGYTDNNRLQILALKPAPVQVSYLGFPGTTGANFIDYIIADKTVIPDENKKYLSEKVVYLPNSYQVNSYNHSRFKIHGQRPRNDSRFKRKDFGLPEKSFVFASFNGIYKIEPRVFDNWMRVLKKVPGSILWLLKTNDTAEINLKKEAKKRGVDPKRLIFSGRLPKEKHLSRLALADLALDTFTCNGHTSTSDALWAGLPVITLEGSHFASRVSASLLKAVGLPELIVHSPQKYESLAVSLANKRSKLYAIRSMLYARRLSAPLFDTEKFTKNLESVYLEMYKTKYANSKTNNR